MSWNTKLRIARDRRNTLNQYSMCRWWKCVRRPAPDSEFCSAACQEQHVKHGDPPPTFKTAADRQLEAQRRKTYVPVERIPYITFCRYDNRMIEGVRYGPNGRMRAFCDGHCSTAFRAGTVFVWGKPCAGCGAVLEGKTLKSYCSFSCKLKTKWKRTVVRVKQQPVAYARPCIQCGEQIGGDRRKRYCGDQCRALGNQHRRKGYYEAAKAQGRRKVYRLQEGQLQVEAGGEVRSMPPSGQGEDARSRQREVEQARHEATLAHLSRKAYPLGALPPGCGVEARQAPGQGGSRGAEDRHRQGSFRIEGVGRRQGQDHQEGWLDPWRQVMGRWD